LYVVDYVQCEYCGRRFNETAARRHIPFCKEQHERLPKKKPEQATAAQKQAMRTQVSLINHSFSDTLDVSVEWIYVSVEWI